MAEDSAEGEDEEEEEEEEEDDLAASTQHSVSPNSQELFVTQMELSSQPSQATSPDSEAMEATSGDCTFFKPPYSIPKAISDKAEEKEDARQNVLGNHGSNPQ
ncbi:myelin transcription factor 1-like [Gopherus flavomarginatus]|uniref:myelin transcription factor 1-like n=1 Tax=Gopherus flavomarginatus TaxID=286002 RepID=UPI0021CC33CA|nr:myelin transcription factor 1-like [Gopherus flavomarginatus]